MKPDDIASMVWAGDPQISPDGTQVAYVVTRTAAKANEYRSQIWLAATDGSALPQPLTAGEVADSQPRWSPDGSRIAFTSKRPGPKSSGSGKNKPAASLHVLPATGPGETVTLATSPEGFDALEWSPDGTKLVYVQRTRHERYEADEASQEPRNITHLFSRLDSVGWTVDRPAHIYTIATDGCSEPSDHTPDKRDLSGPTWCPDSRFVVASGALHDNYDLDLAEDLYVIDTGGVEPIRTLTNGDGMYGNPSVSPDGTRVAFIAIQDPLTFPQNFHVGVTGFEPPDDEPVWLSKSLDRNWATYPSVRAPCWLDERSLLASVEDRGNVHLYRLNVDDPDTPIVVVDGERMIDGWDYSQSTLVLASTTIDRPAEISSMIGNTEVVLSSVTDSFVARIKPRNAERFLAPSTGGVEVDAWMVTPPDFDPDKTYPALLNVHGGPFAQYGNSFFDEAQVQAGAGFVVLMSNPRGGSGRENSWGQAIIGSEHPAAPGTGWGSVDYEDCMAVVDTALDRYPFIDKNRLGMLGGSYGGYMATWIASHTPRFRAVCSERAANNLLSLEWASDIAGQFFTEIGIRSFERPDLYEAMSPISYVKDIETPMLIIHSEDDIRCPIDQADQLFMALRTLGKDVEYYRFPGESHELSRSGSPTHRVRRAEIIIEYFTRQLA
ncbi:MAG: S9 family peptidase [Acidimicrobiales bacterium]